MHNTHVYSAIWVKRAIAVPLSRTRCEGSRSELGVGLRPSPSAATAAEHTDLQPTGQQPFHFWCLGWAQLGPPQSVPRANYRVEAANHQRRSSIAECVRVAKQTAKPLLLRQVCRPARTQHAACASQRQLIPTSEPVCLAIRQAPKTVCRVPCISWITSVPRGTSCRHHAGQAVCTRG